MKEFAWGFDTREKNAARTPAPCSAFPTDRAPFRPPRNIPRTTPKWSTAEVRTSNASCTGRPPSNGSPSGLEPSWGGSRCLR